MNGKLYAAAAVFVVLCTGGVALASPRDCEDFSHCWAEKLHWQGRKLLLEPQMTAGEYQRAIVKLKAAVELIGPDNTSARIYKDLYQLLEQISGRPEARDTLLRYVQMQNQDALASQQWLAWQLDQANTIEQRMAILQGFIAKESRQPQEALSDAYRQLGELQYQKFDAAGATSSLKKAIELVDVNLAAWDQLGAISQQSRPEDSGDKKGEKGKADVISRLTFQVEYLLAQIRANPADIDACRQLAKLLDDISLHQQAQVYYRHAIDSYRQLAQGQGAPVGLMLDYANSLFEADKLIQARKMFVELIDNVSHPHSQQAQSSSAPASRPAYTVPQPLELQAHLMLYLIAKKMEDPPALEAQERVFDNYYRLASLDDTANIKGISPDGLAIASVFYSIYGPADSSNKLGGLELARLAAGGQDPGDQADPQIKLAGGLARLMTGHYDQAVDLLEPLAQRHQLAAVGLALVHVVQGRSEMAIELLNDAGKLKITGPAYQQLVAVLGDLGQEPPKPTDRSDIEKLLGKFNTEVLKFFHQPHRYLEMQLELTGDVVRAQPIRAICSIKNNSGFTVTIGPAMMINPNLQLKITARLVGEDEDNPQSVTFFKLVQLDTRQALQPGSMIRFDLFLDLAARRGDQDQVVTLAQWLERHSDRSVQISVAGILDALETNGAYRPGPGGFERQLLVIDSPAVAAQLSVQQQEQLLLDLVAGKSAWQAGEGALLLAKVLAGDGSLDSKRQTKIFQAILDLLGNDDWRIRVAGTYACRLLEPGQPLFNGLAPGLGDRHWLVRLTTADVLAQLQGITALPILEHLARNDSQALVRQLATSYLLDMHK